MTHDADRAEVTPDPGDGDPQLTSAGSRQPPGSAQMLADRYGSGRRRRFDRRIGWIVAGLASAAGLIVVLFGGWLETNPVDQQDISFTKEGDAALVMKYHVSAPPQTRAACAIEALNTAKATVGWKVVELPPSDERTRIMTTRVLLTNPATAATVKECWALE